MGSNTIVQQEQQQQEKASDQPLHKVVSHDRLDSSARNGDELVINTQQTDGAIETVADEDVPLKDTNNGRSVSGGAGGINSTN